ncbi:hypothetical protein HYFRA_00001997 [Hymenoscyphus fraxineus]|uniref:aldehyde dehydrogenase (NAD(+)) n=1 Tax=Hymenoscyphus fraxineus TaxID=746836 RepID=A0A9N9PEA0_9HELO|nr:hypothetical protein HYFRA_00001997 [Hymenoscyphus fraxineus]
MASEATTKTEIETRLFINGEHVPASNGETFDLISSKTGEAHSKITVSEASEEDTNRAVAAAKTAQPAWSALTVQQRGSYLKKLATLIRQHDREFAFLEAQSMGHPVSSYFHAAAAAVLFEHYAEAGYDIQGTSSLATPGFVNLTFRQPYGVVAAIIPWNVPVLFFAKKVAPALIVGNTVVLKSSEKAPLTSARLASLIKEAGFPKGVVNVLSGGPLSGSVLSHHMDVRALSFTGSTRTGRLIQEAASKSNLKVVSLELGGKTPAIVFDDACLELAAQATQYSIQTNSGQTCMGNSRIYVQDTVAERFIDIFKSKFSTAKIGDPTDYDTNHGPIVDKIQYDKVIEYLEIGKKEGTVILGNEAYSSEDGYFIKPTIILDTPEDSRIMKEEVFGPVVNINIFKTEEEALKKANDSEYGLYASVFTQNIERAMRVAKGLEAGTVGVNCSSPTTGADTPFGGYKGSGIGREGIPYHSLDFFLETKAVLVKIG